MAYRVCKVFEIDRKMLILDQRAERHPKRAGKLRLRAAGGSPITGFAWLSWTVADANRPTIACYEASQRQGVKSRRPGPRHWNICLELEFDPGSAAETRAVAEKLYAVLREFGSAEEVEEIRQQLQQSIEPRQADASIS